MGDFFQNGVIATLHNLSGRSSKKIAEDLLTWSGDCPMTLIIPALYSEFEGAAMPKILSELKKVNYLSEVIIGLDRADNEQFKLVKKYCRDLPADCRIIWNDGPGMLRMQEDLSSRGLAPLERGKGSNVWYAMGYFLASGKGKILALHDADIFSYKREMLTRLLYPVVNPNFDYIFCKGYYPRVEQSGFQGRVARLLVTPLLRALKNVNGPDPFLDYLDSFRYPLAGEFALDAEVVGGLRIPFDWGLEIGVLTEVFDAYPVNRICQVDIENSYIHKHQEISIEDPSEGLHRMAKDIVKSIFRRLSGDSGQLPQEFHRKVRVAYEKSAEDILDSYVSDAEMNGYPMDVKQEESLVALFSQTLTTVGENNLQSSGKLPLSPTWAVVSESMPGVLDRLKEIVDSENSF